MEEAMEGKAEEQDRAERAFWARLSQSGPEAVQAVKKLLEMKDGGEKSKLVAEFNQGRWIEKPYMKDGINLDDGSRVSVYRDKKGNINLGWSSAE